MKLSIALCRRWRILGSLVLAAGPCQPAQSVEHSLDVRREPPVQGDAKVGESKSAVCAACHGPQGNASVADFPSLAGQSATYLYIQLRAYKNGSRPSDVMRPQVEQLSDQDLKALSVYYASLEPARSSTVAAGESSRAGQKLFEAGDTARGIPPCQGCHGLAGRGPPSSAPADGSRPATAWHTYPTLGGQQAPYIVAQLTAYKNGSRGGTSNARLMEGVARNLDETAMQELAAYLSQQGAN